ncbi:DUF2147 domain-containing protein [Tsuneonella amylolytica]|uniref:DUF2147 domain-containing protein n=1 Tax=Tsuneonella amylolytica TaxID=2338327 RepID=UPI002D79F5F2|nr:DUF2147 domain-containing protein [Tsuneonella amylolytica]
MMKVAMSLAALLAAAPLAAAAPIDGRWVTEEKSGIVQVGDCGGTRCGKLARFLETPPQGVDQRDVNNPEARLRGRKLLGLPILTGFRPDGDVWRGTIYDPKSGKSYRSVLKRRNARTLEVKGCIGPFCQTQLWTRTD